MIRPRTRRLRGPSEIPETKAADPFDEIDFGSYFDDYLDPGYKSPASEISEKPSFETFLSSPVTLDRSSALATGPDRAAGKCPRRGRGNHRQSGRKRIPDAPTSEEIATAEGHEPAVMAEALRVVHTLDPAGVAAADLARMPAVAGGEPQRQRRRGVADPADHLKLVETRQFKELAKVLHRPLEHIEIAVDVIRHLDPRPGLRYSGPGARQVEPDVYISKDGEDYLIQINDEDVPQLRLNPQYRRMLDRDQEPDQGSPQLRQGTVRERDSVDEKHRAAQADHP